jgi:hypothetical protein
VARYRELEQAEDRVALASFVRQRFDERYFDPVDNSRSKHGFTLIAVACLVVEALESFYQGRADTRTLSRQMFRDFFNRDTALKVFAGGNDWFFEDIRCGLIKQKFAADGGFYAVVLCSTLRAR